VRRSEDSDLVGADPLWRAALTIAAGFVLALAGLLSAPPAVLLGLGVTAGAAGGWTLAGIRGERRRREITERRLQESARTAEDIIAAIPSGLVGLDEHGAVCRWNEVATRILGMGRGGMIGQHVDRWPIAGQRGLAALLSDALDGRTVTRGSLDVTRTDGRTLPLGISTSRLAGSGGRGAGAVAVFQDLTEARKLRARMHQQERLAAVGALAASIAHEIRNPLASIAGSVELLAGELPLTGEHCVLMDLILKESDRLNVLITDFLDFTRERRPQPKPLDPAVLLREVLRMVRQRPEADEQLKLTLQAEGAPAVVEADPGMLRQVAINLITNACEAVAWAGTLTITLRTARAAGTGGVAGAAAPAGAASDEFVMEVADDGPGVPVEARARLFEPFFTTKPGGTGLGLAIAHRIVEMHGGQLELLETAGPGSVFQLRLPTRSRGDEDLPEGIVQVTETASQ
jgi:two-component system sensor histidine kinase PilS (NtrC family)